MRLRHRRPADAGHAARGRDGGDRDDRGRLGGPDADDRGRGTAGARHPGPQLRGGHPPRPGARRGAEVLPADLPRVLRTPVVRTRRRPPRLLDPAAGRGGAVRTRPASSRRPTCRASRCTWRSARTCGCPCRPAPRQHSPAPRCSATCPAVRSRSPAPRTGGCWSARRARAAARRTSSPPRARASRRPTCRGTARPWSTSAATCSPRASASPRGRVAASSTSTSTGSGRSGSGRGPSTTTDGGLDELDRRAVPGDRRRAAAADRRHRAATQGRPVPVRARRRRAPGAGLLRGLQHPGLRVSSSDSTPSASRGS